MPGLVSQKYKRSIVVLVSDKSRARNERELHDVWEKRIKKDYPHYRVKHVEQHPGLEGE